MRTVATMVLNGRYKVMYDDKAKFNPYKVYMCIGNHRHMMSKYADLSSAMVELSNIAYIKEMHSKGERA